jgi:5-methylthioadenosine/S-adenosylhomocysteine deaminase
MTQVLKSARILDWKGGMKDGAHPTDILVDSGYIKRMAEHVDVPDGAAVMDALHFLVTPGLVNAHGHLAMTLLRGLADEVPLETWLTRYMFPREARMNGDDVYYGSLLALAEGIMSGTTAFAEMYFHEDDVARAVTEAGVRANLCIGASSSADDAQKMKSCEEFVLRWNGKEGGRIHAGFGPHAPYTTTPSFVRENFERARDLGVVVQFHLHETQHELEQFAEQYGASPITYYADQGMFDAPPRLLAAHCVHDTP